MRALLNFLQNFIDPLKLISLYFSRDKINFPRGLFYLLLMLPIILKAGWTTTSISGATDGVTNLGPAIGADTGNNAVVVWGDSSSNLYSSLFQNGNGSSKVLVASSVSLAGLSVFMYGDGHANVVWWDNLNDTISVARLTSLNPLTWGSTISFSMGANGTNVVAAQDASGNIVAGYVDTLANTVYAVTIGASDSSWTQSSALTTSSAIQFCSVDANSSKAIIVYEDSSGKVQARTFTFGGSWSSQIGSGLTPSHTVDAMQAALNANNQASVLFSGNNTANPAVGAFLNTSTGSWSAVTTLSTSGNTTAAPSIAMTSSGTTTALWTEVNGSSQVFVSHATLSGGSWSTASQISSTFASTYSPYETQILYSPYNDLLLCWNVATSGSTPNQVQVSTKTGGASSFASPTTLSTNGLLSQYSSHAVIGRNVALSGQGTLFVPWEDGTSGQVRVSYTILPFPPSSLSGEVINCQFINATDRVHSLTWPVSPCTNLSQYTIYRNGEQINNPSITGPFQYQDHNQSSSSSDLYQISVTNDLGEGGSVSTSLQ